MPSGQEGGPLTRDEIVKLQQARRMGLHLHHRLTAGVVFDIRETIEVDAWGGASVVRETDPWEAKLPTEELEDITRKVKRLADLPVNQEFFEAGHRFPGVTVVGVSAQLLDGTQLEVSETHGSGSFVCSVQIPIERDRKGEFTIFTFPGYVLRVRLSKLPEKLGDNWFLQWTHGALGETRFMLTVGLPELRRHWYERVLKAQHVESMPIHTGVVVHQGSKEYSWACRLRRDDTFRATIAYGKRYRKWLFSPAGFIVSNLLIIVLTIVFTPLIEMLLKGIGL